jgi:hypothetical protein
LCYANNVTLHNPLYNYSAIKRKDTAQGRRYLTPDGGLVASVTTILDKTKPQEKKQALQEWRKRVGETQAAAITSEAANRGTSMHSHLEHWLDHGSIENKSNLIHQQSGQMATLIIENYLKPNLNEYWGTETALYYTGLYAGTTDLVGLYNGVPSIIDFKQTNKTKKTEWIEDYFLQTCAYAHAHNHIFGTDIQQCVILMCSKDLVPQHWVVEKEDFEKNSDLWWKRVEQFYNNQS